MLDVILSFFLRHCSCTGRNAATQSMLSWINGTYGGMDVLVGISAFLHFSDCIIQK